MLPMRSTWRRVASPRKDSISWTSHWNRSVVSGVSGRIHAEPRRRIAPRRWSFRHTPTRCRVGVGGSVVRRVSQLTSDKVTLATSFVKRYTPTSLLEEGSMGTDTPAPRIAIRDLVRYYLRLGLLGFGGPVALVGQMERELVGERKWLSQEEMREGIEVCQSLPGPLAIQVGIWISYIRGGFWGAWAGGWPQCRLPSWTACSATESMSVASGHGQFCHRIWSGPRWWSRLAARSMLRRGSRSSAGMTCPPSARTSPGHAMRLPRASERWWTGSSRPEAERRDPPQDSDPWVRDRPY